MDNIHKLAWITTDFFIRKNNFCMIDYVFYKYWIFYIATVGATNGWRSSLWVCSSPKWRRHFWTIYMTDWPQLVLFFLIPSIRSLLKYGWKHLHNFNLIKQIMTLYNINWVRLQKNKWSINIFLNTFTT